MARIDDVRRFYDLLRDLERVAGRPRRLGDPGALTDLPPHGVYFFFEDGEVRDSGDGLRVVRVGTHGVSEGSLATLRQRLAQHRGSLRSGGGNHRGSIFRLLIGEALATRAGIEGWSGNHPTAGERAAEAPLERRVSEHLRWAMSFVCLPVPGVAGSRNERAFIERECIGLLSNAARGKAAWIDPPSGTWLGRCSAHKQVRASGLWNCRGIDQRDYDAGVLDRIARSIRCPAV